MEYVSSSFHMLRCAQCSIEWWHIDCCRVDNNSAVWVLHYIAPCSKNGCMVEEYGIDTLEWIVITQLYDRKREVSWMKTTVM